MGFVNEYISKEDVIKFGLLDLKNKYLPKNRQYESIDDCNVKDYGTMIAKATGNGIGHIIEKRGFNSRIWIIRNLKINK